ncbi:DUF4355 domain-containing protein [Sporosarcina sp. P17b]|uniref:DUF4355 domain-containing protein n=1 Tax=Sporosarcina sp. P17b TaxID=2048260 RepID=UPI001304514F|nr:DUF4355 domain-containing protein [Sporosarcina sp. P17b]
MTIDEIRAFLEANKDKDEVKQFLTGLQGAVDVQKIEQLSQSDATIKSWLDSQKDRHSSKSLETWKANNLQSLIEEKLKELNPDKSPQDIELEKIRKQLADMEREKQRESLKNKALTIVTEKGLPTSAIDFFLGEDEDTTLQNLEKYENELKSFGQQMVEKSMKKNEYTPPGTDGSDDKGTGSRFAKAANDSAKPVDNKIWE